MVTYSCLVTSKYKLMVRPSGKVDSARELGNT